MGISRKRCVIKYPSTFLGLLLKGETRADDFHQMLSHFESYQLTFVGNGNCCIFELAKTEKRLSKPYRHILTRLSKSIHRHFSFLHPTNPICLFTPKPAFSFPIPIDTVQLQEVGTQQDIGANYTSFIKVLTEMNIQRCIF